MRRGTSPPGFDEHANLDACELADTIVTPTSDVASDVVTPELPALASRLLSQHLSLGCSRGFMFEHRNDWEHFAQ